MSWVNPALEKKTAFMSLGKQVGLSYLKDNYTEGSQTGNVLVEGSK